MTDTPYAVQIAIDCADPHELARWWAEALRWQVEPQDESFIRSMIDQGHATEADTRTYRGALVWATASAINHPDGGNAPRILFQQVPEPKTTKNRVHLDLHTAGDPTAEELDRLLALGATRVGHGNEGPHHWVVLTDPEENELCLPIPTPTSDAEATGG